MASSPRPPPPPPPTSSSVISSEEGRKSAVATLFNDPASKGRRVSVKVPGLSTTSDDNNIAGKAKSYHDLSNAVKDIGSESGNTENLLNNFLNEIVTYRWKMKQPYSYIGSKHLMIINPLHEDNLVCNNNEKNNMIKYERQNEMIQDASKKIIRHNIIL